MSLEQAQASYKLAKNQGLYNGFLAAGLIWSMVTPDPVMSSQLKIFFLACIVIAGSYGARTVNKRIFFVQAMPALLALMSLSLAI